MCEEIKSLEEIDNLAVKQCITVSGKVQSKKGLEEAYVKVRGIKLEEENVFLETAQPVFDVWCGRGMWASWRWTVVTNYRTSQFGYLME